LQICPPAGFAPFAAPPKTFSKKINPAAKSIHAFYPHFERCSIKRLRQICVLINVFAMRKAFLEEFWMTGHKTIKNPGLVQALAAMHADPSRKNQARLVKEILQAHFITPVIVPPEMAERFHTEAATYEEGTRVSFILLTENTLKQNYFLAFTDWEELSKWQQDDAQETMIVTFEDLCRLVTGPGVNAVGFVINPFGGCLPVDRFMFKRIRKREPYAIIPK
jgi:hypothetical protein